MNNLYDLVKRIDALTANSQQVLNALIRSCVASGSSSGYKVTKYGNEIVLTRSDIYRLYDFYQSWESENFPSDETSFYSILSAADARWRKTISEDSALATEAVVKHSQILFMTASDASKTGEANYDYWLERIRNSVSPKVTVSTAPIPLNLRTPLYDENLSVKSFSQYETYLFPIGYQRAELLGIPGDEESYLAGGKNWAIDVTDTLTFSGNRINLGKVSNPENRLANYGDSINTLSWGGESYAFKDNSAAFGFQSVAVAPGAVVFGRRSRGFGPNSFIGGGEELVTVGTRGFASNYNNYAIGDNSFAANRKNVTGGYPYRFEFITSTDITTVPCETIEISTEGKCVATSTLQAQALTASKKVMRISAGVIDASGMPFEIKEGDTIVVYDHIYNGMVRGSDRTSYITGGVTACDLDGYASARFVTTVAAVSPKYIERNGVRTLSEMQITLDNPIPVENPLYNLTGAYISRQVGKINTTNSSLALSGKRNLRLGENSATFGYNNIATGDNQLVAGISNTSNYEANFIVGTGTAPGTSSSYVGSANSLARSNGLVVAPYYGYMRLADGSAVMGVAGGNSTIDDQDRTKVYRGSFMYSRSSAYIRTGTSYVHGGTSYVTATPASASMETYLADGKSNALISASAAPGVLVNPSYNVATVVRSLQGTAVIAAGSYLRSDGTSEGGVDNALLTRSSVIKNSSDNAVAIYAQDGIDIRNTDNRLGRGINIETCSYLTLSFKALRIKGDTFGELTATDEAQSFWLAQRQGGTGTTGKMTDILYGNTSGRSGFYFGTNGQGFAMPYTPQSWEGQGLHVFNSTVYNDKDRLYHTASLTIADRPNTDIYRSVMGTAYISSSYWRPMVTVSSYSGIGNSNSVGNARSYHLATYEDTVEANVWSSGPMMRCGFSTITDTKSDSRIMGPLGITDSMACIYMPIATYESTGKHWKVSSKYRAYPVCILSSRTLGVDAAQVAQMGMTFSNRFDIRSALGSGLWGNGGGSVYMSYTLNGNWLDLEMQFNTSGNGPLKFDTDYRGIRIPFFLGCGVVDHSKCPGSSLATFEEQTPSADGSSTKYRIIPGHITTGYKYAKDDGEYDFQDLHAEAKVFNDGFLYIELRCVVSGSIPANIRVTFSGIVPFVAASMCRTDWISPEWVNFVRGVYGLDSASSGRRYGDVEDDLETDE